MRPGATSTTSRRSSTSSTGDGRVRVRRRLEARPRAGRDRARRPVHPAQDRRTSATATRCCLIAGGKDGYVGRDGRCPRARRPRAARIQPARPAPGRRPATVVTAHTAYLTFETDERREFVRITDDVRRRSTSRASARAWSWSRRCTSPPASGSTTTSRASRRTCSSGSTSSRRRAGRSRRTTSRASCSPDPGDYRHHRGGEDNGDAHLKNLLVHHQAIVPVTDGKLDLGPWQAIFYCEFDGRRPKRLVIKVLGRMTRVRPR